MRWCTLAVVLIVASSPARADDADAKRLYDEGLRHYDIAEYRAAIDAWKQAYLKSKAPLLLFNIGQAYRLGGDCTTAMKFYDSYAREEPNPTNQDELDQAADLCKGKVHASENPTRDLFGPPAEPRPAAAGNVDHRKRFAGYVSGGAGLALVVASAYLAHHSSVLAQRNADAVNVDHVWGQTQLDNQRTGQLDNKLAWTFGVVGVAAIGAGVALFVMSRTDEPAIAVVPANGGASVSWATRF